MKELVEIIAKALVDNPDEVVVTETVKEKAIILELKVAPSDTELPNPSEQLLRQPPPEKTRKLLWI